MWLSILSMGETQSYLISEERVESNVVRANLDVLAIPGSTLGCDFSGIVEAVGPNVKKSWNVGDRVSGWVVGNNVIRKDDGSFAEYVVANGELSMKVPDNLSDEEAAGPPAGIGTVGIGLCQQLGMVLPGEGGGGKGESVLIYGGTSATATIGIQLAKL